MGKAILLEDHDNERIYKLANNRIITICIDDDSVVSYIENGIEIGNYEDFLFIEDEFEPAKYLLARMYVPIKGQGLGRATLIFFTEYYGAVVWARVHDGITRDDGSHLTEDAPGFVDKMIAEGLLIDNQDKGDYYDRYD